MGNSAADELKENGLIKLLVAVLHFYLMDKTKSFKIREEKKLYNLYNRDSNYNITEVFCDKLHT